MKKEKDAGLNKQGNYSRLSTCTTSQSWFGGAPAFLLGGITGIGQFQRFSSLMKVWFSVFQKGFHQYRNVLTRAPQKYWSADVVMTYCTNIKTIFAEHNP